MQDAVGVQVEVVDRGPAVCICGNQAELSRPPRPLSAPGRAPGRPEPRSASVNEPLGPRWHPGHSGLALYMVGAHMRLGDGSVDQRVALAVMCGGGGVEAAVGGRGRASGGRRAARRTRAIGRISVRPCSRRWALRLTNVEVTREGNKPTTSHAIAKIRDKIR